MRKNGKIIQCQACKKEFYIKKYQFKWKRYCSIKCYNFYRKTGKNIHCKICNKEFYVHSAYLKTKKYCSKKCQHQSMRGKILLYKRTGLNIYCYYCNKNIYRTEFRLKSYKKQFCSCQCYSKYLKGKKRLNKRTGKSINCLNCKKLFYIPKCKINEKKFCSRKCTKTGQKVNCQNCNKKIYRTKRSIKNNNFCSNKCYYQWRTGRFTGKNSCHWRGGISKEPYPFHFDSNFKRQIKERDNYTCQLCDTTNKLRIHHIDYIKENTTELNCITLCHSCNPKVNFNREHWTNFFQEKIKQISKGMGG